MTATIFINYRRGDDPGFTHALYHQLEDEFGRDKIFMDVQGQIRPGDDFVEVLNSQVAQADIVLVIIGPRWAELMVSRRSREDFVAIEIAAALHGGKRVIPVLVGGASMPNIDVLPDDIRTLTRRNAVDLRPEHFRSDCNELLTALKALSPKPLPAPPPQPPRRPAEKREQVHVPSPAPQPRPVRESGPIITSTRTPSPLWKKTNTLRGRAPMIALGAFGALGGAIAGGLLSTMNVTLFAKPVWLAQAIVVAVLLLGSLSVLSDLQRWLAGLVSVLAGVGWLGAEVIAVGYLQPQSADFAALPLSIHFIWGVLNWSTPLFALAYVKRREGDWWLWLLLLLIGGLTNLVYGSGEWLSPAAKSAIFLAVPMLGIGYLLPSRNVNRRPESSSV